MIRSGRRGLLRAIGIAAAAPAAAKAAAAPPPTVFRGPADAVTRLRSYASDAGMVVGSSESSPAEARAQRRKWRLFDELQRPVRRANRRREIEAGLLNGWPPHIASTRSWAPWFRAQRAAAWIEAREERDADLWESLRRRVFGDEEA